MSNQITDPRTAVAGGVMTRRSLLLSLPGLTLASRLFARNQAAPLRIQGLHQVTLAVSDLERSLDFYQGLFGMAIQARHGETILLRIGDGPHFLALTEAGSEPPSIARFGLAVEDFDVGRVVGTLAGHDVTPGDWTRDASGVGWAGGPMRIGRTIRGDTIELDMGDPNGLVIQLHDPSYCGGEGRLGNRCGPPEPSPTSGSIALSGLSHLTINVPDPEATNAFYQQTFGMDIQAYQAASPLLGVGDGVHFLMFIGAGGGGTGPARINHVSLSLENFDLERIQGQLEEHGITPRGAGGQAAPLQHRVSMRMPNRGGAPDGTPELYFSDPDGLSIQLQDVTYCGGGGYLGGVCP
jgi:catechol 2,3-dioxygenase-like lactoylglutathione lyase family enzyme